MEEAEEEEGDEGGAGGDEEAPPSSRLLAPSEGIPSVPAAAAAALSRVARAAWRAAAAAADADGGHHGARLLSQNAAALSGALGRLPGLLAAPGGPEGSIAALLDACSRAGERAREAYARSLLAKERLLPVVELAERAGTSAGVAPPSAVEVRAALAPAGVASLSLVALPSEEEGAEKGREGPSPPPPTQLPAPLAKRLASLSARAERHFGVVPGGGGGGAGAAAAAAEAAAAAVAAAEAALESAARALAASSSGDSDASAAASALAAVLGARRRWRERQRRGGGSAAAGGRL